ncbi:hypothetical protein CCO03_11120 [Comamonas serinivorans]|uniref:DUF2157 domain-containing protein n=1 Tax=Comamonas serinivorans TaxID=1082851 RepID=A0A1Y0ENY4_9BURK|nr:DUF2157 domain-containing protein [Comamonas serinivorans]ARU05168.1 hypothetical protein CCO03_11120 [Comamonas serinivorans]
MDEHLYRAAQAAHPDARAPLYRLATRPPEALASLLARGLALVAALLLGCGLIFWIAANWQAQTRGFKLGLIEAALAVCVLAAIAWPRARTAALLAAGLMLGGLLAFVGQTYQTGADAWQLFAAWAGLLLVWTLTQRSDLLWTLWVLVAGLGLTFWSGRGDEWLWFSDALQPSQIAAMVGWLLLAGVPCAVASLPWTRLPGGLGRVSWRVASAIALANWTTFGVLALVWGASRSGLAVLAGGLIGVLGLLAWQSRWRDGVVLALAALALNVMVWTWLAEAVLSLDFGVGGFAVLTLLAMLGLGGSASWLMQVQRGWARQADHAQEVA